MVLSLYIYIYIDLVAGTMLINTYIKCLEPDMNVGLFVSEWFSAAQAVLEFTALVW